MEFFVENINLLLFLPLFVCAALGFNRLVSNRIDRVTMFFISFVSTLVCLVFSVVIFAYSMLDKVSVVTGCPWLETDNINFYLGTFIDKTSASFLFASSIISLLLHFYTYFRLKNIADFTRLVFYLNLFLLGFNGVFISPNIFQSYLFCEIVGIASYLLINFDFGNRDESRSAIKSFIYNRIGDLTLLFSVLCILYYAVIYNQQTNTNSLAYTNMTDISISINSLMSEPVFVFFCSILLFVIVMKFMQAFVYLMFEPKENSSLSKVIFFQNIAIALVGVYLFLRLYPFFSILGGDWKWTILVLVLMFIVFGVLNKLFIPLCKLAGWIEKYVVEGTINFAELVFRAVSYLITKIQAGNFQSYLIYSLIGIVFLLGFILLFYVILIKG